MDAQQAEAASALAACDEGPEARCPLWRQVQEEARSMVRPTCLLVVLQDRTCFKHVEHTFLRIIHVSYRTYDSSHVPQDTTERDGRTFRRDLA